MKKRRLIQREGSVFLIGFCVLIVMFSLIIGACTSDDDDDNDDSFPSYFTPDNTDEDLLMDNTFRIDIQTISVNLVLCKDLSKIDIKLFLMDLM